MFTVTRHGTAQRADKMEITRMQPDDVSGIHRLEIECFSSPWSQDSIKHELSNPMSHFFVAKLGEQLIGYIGTQLVLDECYITNIAVTKTKRGKGIGSSLLETATQNAKLCGASFITLEVRQSNAVAIELYKKHGFIPQGKRRNFYNNPTEDGLIMTKKFKEGEAD